MAVILKLAATILMVRVGMRVRKFLRVSIGFLIWTVDVIKWSRKKISAELFF